MKQTERTDDESEYSFQLAATNGTLRVGRFLACVAPAPTRTLSADGSSGLAPESGTSASPAPTSMEAETRDEYVSVGQAKIGKPAHSASAAMVCAEYCAESRNTSASAIRPRCSAFGTRPAKINRCGAKPRAAASVCKFARASEFGPSVSRIHNRLPGTRCAIAIHSLYVDGSSFSSRLNEHRTKGAFESCPGKLACCRVTRATDW